MNVDERVLPVPAALRPWISAISVATVGGDGGQQYVRIDRVRAVLAAARDRRWAQLAADAGYYDQSHMTAEFRRIMGVPPSAFIAGALPAASSCGPPSTP